MVYQTLHRTLKLEQQTHSKPRGWTNAKYFDIEWVKVDNKKSLKKQCIKGVFSVKRVRYLLHFIIYNDNAVCFVPDQHAECGFYTATSLKQ
jgi:hypothetical protein